MYFNHQARISNFKQAYDPLKTPAFLKGVFLTLSLAVHCSHGFFCGFLYFTINLNGTVLRTHYNPQKCSRQLILYWLLPLIYFHNPEWPVGKHQALPSIRILFHNSNSHNNYLLVLTSAASPVVLSAFCCGPLGTESWCCEMEECPHSSALCLLRGLCCLVPSFSILLFGSETKPASEKF